MNLLESCRAIWGRVRQSETQVPVRGPIHFDRVRPGPGPSGVFQPNQHYFQVRINEVFLAHERKWLREYDPMVVVLSEFAYGRQNEALPFVVGPSMLRKSGLTELPSGMVFADTRVAGLHPYRGGRLNLSVILCRVVRQDYARQLLGTIESAACALDFSASLGLYLKIGKVVIEGIDSLLSTDDNQALVGLRREFDPDAGQRFTEGFHVLMHAPEGEVRLDDLWVIGGKLHIGQDEKSAVPFRGADYVLYSIVGTAARTDLSTLPFYELWERVQSEAAVPTDEAWKSAKANMVSLYQSMIKSPDLTPAQAKKLVQELAAEMKSIHDGAVGVVSLEAATRSVGKPLHERADAAILDDDRSDAVAMLDL